MQATYTYGTAPPAVITAACNDQCKSGYPMTINNQYEWATIAAAVNKGIDSHLEAITERSTFNPSTGECLVHPDELHVLLRRLNEGGTDEGMELRTAILSTLGIEEV
jgi:hypothetical protein